MTQEEALNIITSALEPESLTPLQIKVFQGAWNMLSYEKIASELSHDYSYITDVGTDLWKLLSQKLKIKVSKVKLHSALARYAQQEQMRNLSSSSQGNRVDWGEAPDTSQFCGRQAQLNILEQWIVQGNCRAIAITGMGGIGKTMLVARLTQQLADKGMFDVVVWRSLRQAPPFTDFLTELIRAISPEQSLPLRLDAMIRQLLEQLRHHRCLLILDNVEAVMQDGKLVGTYQPGYEDYGWLFQQLGAGRHQSTILLTSREIPAEVAIGQGLTSPIRLLRLKPLSSEAGKIILAAKGLTFPGEQAQVKELIKRYRGNPLALKTVATPIKELFNSKIVAFLAQEALLFTEIRELLTQQFNRLSSLERQVMHWLAINREPVTAAQLQADTIPSVSLLKLRDALVSLDRRSLIEKIKLPSKPTTKMKLDCVSYTQQPLVKEYVIEKLVEQVSQEVEQAKIIDLRSHVLLKVQAEDVRGMQMQQIVQPILTRLIEVQGGSENLNQLLKVQPSAKIYLLAKRGRIPTIELWNIQLGSLHLFACILERVLALAFRVIEPEVNWISFVAFSFREQCLGNEDGTVKLQDLQRYTRPVVSISFNPQENLLVSSGFEQTVNLWNLLTKIALVTLQALRSPIPVAFAPEGKMLVSSSKDGTICLWDSFTGNCLKVLSVERPYAEANISGVTGLTDAQKKMLRLASAIQL
ncbi:NB-ARC domain-containing protein [Chlorogloea sp. CCALA 695]|uniref:NB-ARC domain-containing protein n=1 Tax=Chlorogloea sp. CCALA 695 TaxID=2107693 RepID=UPI000D054B83|nr:NB-ARC domain-containing protein [Chlorogloea sp. CCALA 695]PSB28591.1 hypothetical protein C7B70_20680 [Chlorogloea sp. CCALA 695]